MKLSTAYETIEAKGQNGGRPRFTCGDACQDENAGADPKHSGLKKTEVSGECNLRGLGTSPVVLHLASARGRSMNSYGRDAQKPVPDLSVVPFGRYLFRVLPLPVRYVLKLEVHHRFDVFIQPGRLG